MEEKSQPSAKPATEGWIDGGNGHQLYWAAYGNPDGKPVLMIHGGGGHLIDPDTFKVFSPDTHRIIFLHQRGVGKSLPLGRLQDNTIDQNTDDMERLRQHLNIPKWDLFAWSFGAVLMVNYGAKYPANCGQLISYAPYLATEEDWDVVRERHPDKGRKFFSHFNAANGTEYVRNAFNTRAKATHDEHLASFYNNYKSGGGKDDFDTFLKSKNPAEWDRKVKEGVIGGLLEKEALIDQPAGWLASRTAGSQGFTALPVTLMFGDNDLWSGENSMTKRICPQATVVSLLGATHDVHDSVIQSQISHYLKSGQKRTVTPTPPSP